MWTSREPALEVPASTPAAAGEGTSNAAGCGSDRVEGSKNPTVRLVSVYATIYPGRIGKGSL